MSATNRSDVRHPDDFYATPAWATLAILRYAARPGDIVLDPACGDGAILDVAAECNFKTIGLELDEGRARRAAGHGKHVAIIRDALDVGAWPRAEAIVMNPPFGCAMEFVERAIAEARVCDANVAALLRLPWLASRKRVAFHRAHPSDVYVLPRRPSFTPDGKTDATDYAWFVWGPSRGGRWSILDVAR